MQIRLGCLSKKLGAIDTARSLSCKPCEHYQTGKAGDVAAVALHLFMSCRWSYEGLCLLVDALGTWSGIKSKAEPNHEEIEIATTPFANPSLFSVGSVGL